MARCLGKLSVRYGPRRWAGPQHSVIGCGHPWRVVAALVAVVLALPRVGCGQSAAHAVPSLDVWRAQATQTRVLAENDAPRAYEAAKRLQTDLPLDATPADRARSLNLLSRIETYLALTEPAAAHAHAAFELAARSGDRVGEGESDLNLALNAINQGKLDEMVAATERSVSHLQGADRPDLLGEAMLRMTAMYRRFERFDESVAIAVQALETARRANNPLALAYAHQGMAVAYDQSFRFLEAREHTLQMAVQARAAHSRLLEAFARSGLAGLEVETGDLHEAEQLTREAIGMFREVGVPFATSYGLFGLADLSAKQGRHHDALQYLNESLDIYRHYPNRISEWYALNARSTEYQALGSLTESADDAERAHGIAQALGIASYLSGSATRLASIAAVQGNYKRAYALSMEASEMTAKAARERAGPRVVELVNRYESQSKQHRIDELTRHNQLQATELAQRELQQRWLWTVLAGAIVALAVVMVLVIRQRRSQRQLEALNEQLQTSESHVRSLNADLERRVQVRTAEARQQTHYLRTLIDMLPMWAWFKDTHSRYLVVNQAHALARGHSVAAMEGRSDLQLLPAGVARQQLSDDKEVMDSRERKTTEECVANDDSGVWMETYKAAVLDDDGTVLGMVGVARNISERKATEAAREEALSEARKLAHQRSQFLAHMSHELRSPLNSIMGFAQILQRDKTLSERQGKAIRMIDESGRHLLTLINDVLDLARIDAGKLELVPGDTHVTTFLHAICGAIQVKADGKDLQFALEMAADLPPMIRVDERRLRQVLLNLLSNAVKFTDSGRVTLRVKRRVSSAGKDAAANAVTLRFEVDDEGIGMSEMQQSRLFQPFEQVGDTQRREGGTGLGLAISRQLIQIMGGEISVRSRLGAGSVFAFEIEVPQSQGRSESRVPQHVPIGYPGERRRILIADDVPQNRAMLVEALGGLGFEMTEAENGREALQAVAKLRPHLVVIDLAMPVMDGFEAMRRLRQLPAGLDLPIIATSASASAETEAASSAAGANAFISKPIQEATLLRVIAALLRVDWICDPTATLAGES